MSIEAHKALVIKVRDKLIAQGKQALSGTGCMLRGANGTACAIGCLIDDKHYSSSLEKGGQLISMIRDTSSHGIETLNIFKKALELSGVPTDTDTLNILMRMQRIHDGEDGDLVDVSSWEDQFNALIADIESGIYS